MKILYFLGCLLFAIGCNAYGFSKDVVINGNSADNSAKDGVIQFRVTDTVQEGKNAGKVWTCLRVELNLEIVPSNYKMY